MKFEIIEYSTGARMSHTERGQITTVFKSFAEAEEWLISVGLTHDTHSIRPGRWCLWKHSGSHRQRRCVRAK
jgi:hypothetical protein